MSDEKTEDPTPHKLQEARKKGQVAVSREVISVAVFAGVLGVLWWGRDTAWMRLGSIIDLALAVASRKSDAAGADWRPEVMQMLVDALWLIVPVLGISLVAGIGAGFLQVRGLFSMHPLIPDLSRLNPAEGLKRLVSSRSAIELVKMVVKAVLLTAMIGSLLLQALPLVFDSMYSSVPDIAETARTLMLSMMGAALAIYLVSAGADYAHQRYEYMKTQRMSIDEVRREYKELEGNPEVKGERRATAREMAYSAPQDVASASVMVVNPTHVAVALYYRAGVTGLPVVVAKGTDEVAAAMREVARKNGVPLFENRTLARRLHSEIPVKGYITADLIEPVAEVFRWLKQTKEAQAGAAKDTAEAESTGGTAAPAASAAPSAASRPSSSA